MAVMLNACGAGGWDTYFNHHVSIKINFIFKIHLLYTLVIEICCRFPYYTLDGGIKHSRAVVLLSHYENNEQSLECVKTKTKYDTQQMMHTH